MFAVAILASSGVAALVRWLDRWPRLLAGVLAALLIGIGFEYVAIWPFPVSSAEIPSTVQRIAGEPGDGARSNLVLLTLADRSKHLCVRARAPLTWRNHRT